MFRNLKAFTVGAAVLAGSVAWGTSEADAFWGHSSGGSYGSWGSSGGSWGSSGGSWGSSGGSWGSSGGYYYGSYGGHHHRHHHRRAYYGSWGSSGGSWGSSGGYYYGSWGSSGGSWGSSGGSWGSTGGVVVGGDVMAPAAPSMPASPPPPHPSDMPADGTPQPGADLDMPEEGAPAVPTDNGNTFYRPSTNATLTVRVPAEARVFVNGLATTSTGTVRRYVSNGLRAGYAYTYQIRVEVIRDGQTVSETQTVKLQAGDTPNLEFALNGSDSDPIANQPVRTSVTLYVPADARVYLSGNETHSSGEVRTFSTTKLAAGESWGNYVVRVEVDRNGRTLSKEETIAINGGETRDLAIDFDAPQVARAGK
ncbi:MAG TPA: TIGR03000 domain-containing protein [Pirellulales bacterium]|nr:TIGR03000 domain-containing protein [Pirellulales bacterium]